MIILGVDPGSRKTGFGVINYHRGQAVYLASGVIDVSKYEVFEKLKYLYLYLTEIIEKYQPEIGVIEKVFLAKNPDSALKLGQARGVLIAAMQMQTLELHEYSTRFVKQTVTGSGGADKAQVQFMVAKLLNLQQAPKQDASDALAMAITFINARPLTALNK